MILDQVWKRSNFLAFLDVVWCCTMLYSFAMRTCSICFFKPPSNMLQHIATGWLNVCYIALKCCVRLPSCFATSHNMTQQQRSWYVALLRPFGRGLKVHGTKCWDLVPLLVKDPQSLNVWTCVGVLENAVQVTIPTAVQLYKCALLKTINGILQFLSFDWLTGNGIWAHIPLTTNIELIRVNENSWGAQILQFFWAFLIKQLFHSRLLHMRSL